MRAFLFLALLAFVKASSLRNEEQTVPFEIVLQWTGAQTLLRTTCTRDEVASIDAQLSANLGKHMVGVKGFINEADMESDQLLPCDDHVCKADYLIHASKVSQLDSARLNHIKNHLISVCNSLMGDTSKELKYSSACRRSLMRSSCQASMTITPF